MTKIAGEATDAGRTAGRVEVADDEVGGRESSWSDGGIVLDVEAHRIAGVRTTGEGGDGGGGGGDVGVAGEFGVGGKVEDPDDERAAEDGAGVEFDEEGLALVLGDFAAAVPEVGAFASALDAQGGAAPADDAMATDEGKVGEAGDGAAAADLILERGPIGASGAIGDGDELGVLRGDAWREVVHAIDGGVPDQEAKGGLGGIDGRRPEHEAFKVAFAGEDDGDADEGGEEAGASVTKTAGSDDERREGGDEEHQQGQQEDHARGRDPEEVLRGVPAVVGEAADGPQEGGHGGEGVGGPEQDSEQPLDHGCGRIVHR